MVRTLSAVVLALLVAGCGKPEPQAPVRLQVFGDPLEVAGYRELVDAYRTRQPGDRVELIPVGKQKDHMARLATAFAAGDPPDLFVLNFRRFGQFADKGVLEPLGPALEASGGWRAEDFYEPAAEAFRWDGQQLCLPQNVSSLVVYYNKTLFRSAGVPEPAAGWDTRAFLSAALRIRQKARDARGQRVYGLAFEPSLIRLAPFIWTYGDELVDDTAKPTRIAMDRTAAQALHVLKLLRVEGATPGLAQYKAEDHDARFARGGVGMLLQSRRYTTTLRGVEGLDWDVAPFPVARAPVTVLHADAYCQAKAARNPEAARRFVAFALSAEGQALLTRSGRLVPSRRSVAESPEFLDLRQKPASAQVFLDAIPHLRRTPNIAAWHEIETHADVLLEEWYYESGAGEVEGLRGEMAFTQRLRETLQPLLAPPPAAK